MTPTPPPITKHLEIEALRQAVRWQNATQLTALQLAGQLLAARRHREGYEYFLERAQAEPDRPLYLTLAGVFQARLDGATDEAIDKLDAAAERDLGLPQYFRGVTLAELPYCAGRAETVVSDLEFVLAVRDQFPPGFLRAVYRGLATAYRSLGRTGQADDALVSSGYATADPDVPVLITDYWVNAEDGLHFGSPRLVEKAPGVYVAQGYDFADFSFVVTDEGIVAIDAGSNTRNARAALADLRAITSAPISHVILTHAHFDHVGGLDAVKERGTEVIAQVEFPEELRLQNASPPPFAYLLAKGETHRQHVVPDRLVSRPEKLTVGGVEFELHPIPGGETRDGLVVYLPGQGIVFTGDMNMPYLGAPFFPEGSAEGLFEAMQLVLDLQPRLLIHGHIPLTESFPIEAFPGLLAALRDLYDVVVAGVAEGQALVEILHRNHLPDVLREHPDAVMPYLITRNHLIQRVYDQRIGYWRPGGEGIEHIAPTEWAAALDILGGGSADAFASAGTELLDRGDHTLALKLADYGRLRHPDSEALDDLRRQVLHRLIERHQMINPFKLAYYAELAGFKLSPPPGP